MGQLTLGVAPINPIHGFVDIHGDFRCTDTFLFACRTSMTGCLDSNILIRVQDTVEERNALIADVTPYLQEYARMRRMECLVVEMRWGIRESTAVQTNKICMQVSHSNHIKVCEINPAMNRCTDVCH